MSKAEDYLPFIQGEADPYSPLIGDGTQLGDVIIHPDSKWQALQGGDIYDLLVTDGSTFNELLYPKLHAKLGTNVLPIVPAVPGSPFLYKIVADLTGA